jgi:hypothetical protein
MPTGPELREQVRNLLDGLSDIEVRELCIKALRGSYATATSGLKDDGQVQMHGHLGRWLLPLLAERKRADLRGQENNLKEVFLDGLGEPGLEGVFEFVVWFIRAGLAFPLSTGDQNNSMPITVRLTQAGRRLLAFDEDHPLLPGFLERAAQRCPGIDDRVTSLLAQSRACMDHGLVQPAIVLMGVAYEAAVEQVSERLVARKQLGTKVPAMSAALRINAVKAEITKILPAGTKQETDDRFATIAAYEFANELRRRRNDASHTAPTYGFEDRQESEELLVSAGRHLPSLWRPAN